MICGTCGKEFDPENKQKRYCTEECKAVARKANMKRYREKHKTEAPKEYYKTCPVCGVEFTGGRNKIYCSAKCKAKVNNDKCGAIYKADRKPKSKGLDELIRELELEGKTYREWKLEQARKHVTPIYRGLW